MKTNPVGIYLHLPFCKQKCRYCDFYSFSGAEDTFREYVEGVILEIETTPKVFADTLYIGGGTPTILPLEYMEKLVFLLKKHFSIPSSAEITIEANPETVSHSSLKAYRRMGINRISFGVQSMQDKELSALGRAHSANQAAEAITMAKESGFSNISADLMLGIPYQTEKSLLDTLEKIGILDLQHLSIYMLKIERGTPLYKSLLLKHCANDDEMAAFYLAAVYWAKKRGFLQYEISNFAKEGYECKHNLKYWTVGEYIGLGPAAYSYFEGSRYGHSRDFKKYLRNPSGDKTDIDKDAGSEEEKWIMGLRLNNGVPEKDLPDLSCLEQLMQNELVVRKGDRIALTPKGMLISNAIYHKLGYKS